MRIALGYSGQRIVMLPDLGAVIASTSTAAPEEVGIADGDADRAVEAVISALR